MLDKKYIGSKLDDFLSEEEILDEVENIATKKVDAYMLEKEMDPKIRDLRKNQFSQRCIT